MDGLGLDGGSRQLEGGGGLDPRQLGRRGQRYGRGKGGSVSLFESSRCCREVRCVCCVVYAVPGAGSAGLKRTQGRRETRGRLAD